MRTVINVCGQSYSGTTMLDLMLGNGRACFSCGELYALFRPYRSHHFNPACGCGDRSCNHWLEIRRHGPRHAHKNIAKYFGVDVVVDSSKDLCWLIDANRWARKDGFRVFNVAIWKTPIEFAYSRWKRNIQLTSWPREYTEYYARLFECNLPLVGVQYADLATDPAGTLRNLCSVVGLPYFSGKERFWEKTHHHLFGSLGVRKQLTSPHPEIRYESFSQEFSRVLPRLAGLASEATEVLSILTRLRKIDHRAAKGRNLFSKGGPLPNRPLWYYRARLSYMRKRFFPERWPPRGAPYEGS